MKICCISSEAELALAVAAGASLVGLVSQMPSGPGVIDDALIAALVRRVPPGVTSVLLTSRRDVGDLVRHLRELAPAAVQIVDAAAAGTHASLRAALPGVRIIQVIHVVGPASLDEALAVAPHVDALLLDSGNPSATVRELGGTGRRHDWAISRAIREQSHVPVFLAGGLRPQNVREAVDQVGPFGLDVCSGVRTAGALDSAKVEAFMRAATL